MHLKLDVSFEIAPMLCSYPGNSLKLSAPGCRFCDASRRGRAVEFPGAIEVGIRELTDTVAVGRVGEDGLPLDRSGQVGGRLQHVAAARLAAQIKVKI